MLREIPDLEVDARPTARHDSNAWLCFGDARVPVAVEFNRRVNAANAWQLVEHARARQDRPTLLVARETTSDARRILRDHDVAFVDGLGNAHIELPGLLFHVAGRQSKTRAASRPPTRLAGRAGVAAQALLLDPERDWRVTELAEEAMVSVGFAHRVLARLEDDGIVESFGAGPRRVRRIANATALLDLLAEESADRYASVHGYLLAQSPAQLVERLGAALDGADIKYALTGAAGAVLVAPSITAVPVVTAWTEEGLAAEQLLEALGAEPTADGHNLALRQSKGDVGLAFRQRIEELWVANRFRLYVDLRGDPRRGREQADNLRREVIGF